MPTGLILLVVIPLASGALRLIELTGGPKSMPANLPMAAMPLPVVVHIVNASVLALLSAFQFVTGFRRRRPGWHRVAGRLVVACRLLDGLSGLWMTLFYPRAEGLVTCCMPCGSCSGPPWPCPSSSALPPSGAGMCDRAPQVDDARLRHRAGRGHTGADRNGRELDRQPAVCAQRRAGDGRQLGDQPGRGRMGHTQAASPSRSHGISCRFPTAMNSTGRILKCRGVTRIWSGNI